MSTANETQSVQSAPTPPATQSTGGEGPSTWDRTKIVLFIVSTLASFIAGTLGTTVWMGRSLIQLEERLAAVPKINESELRQDIVSLQERIQSVEAAKIDVTAVTNFMNTTNTSITNLAAYDRSHEAKMSCQGEDLARLKAQAEFALEGCKQLGDLRERVARLEAK